MTIPPRIITVDKNAAYSVAVETLKGDEVVDQKTELRQSKYLNTILEQDHRHLKRIVKPMMGLKSLTARRTLSGIEAMNMMRKRQVKDVERDVTAQAAFVCQVFGVVA